MATELRYPKGYVFFDNNGDPLASGTVQYYEAGTTTDEPIYSDAAGATALPNPITLNSAGRAVDGSNNLVAIYLSDAGATDYKEEVKDSGGTTIWTDDDIPQPVDPTAALSDTAKPRIQWATDTSASINLTAGNLGGGRLADTSSNNITYSPISASTAGNGNGYLIKKTSASNTVTFDPDGSETVDGGSTFAWTEDDRAYWFISDGANWQVGWSYLAEINTGDVAAAAASDTAAGVLEIAVQSEMETGTSAVLAVTPGRQAFHPRHPKAWLNYDQTGTPAILADEGITSVSDDTTGVFTPTFDTAFSAVTYAWAGSATGTTGTTFGNLSRLAAGTKSTTQLTLNCSVADSGTLFDGAGNTLVVFGDQ